MRSVALAFVLVLASVGASAHQAPLIPATPPALIPSPRSAVFAESGGFVVTSRTPIVVPGGADEAVRVGEVLSALIGPGVGVGHPDSLDVQPLVETGPPRDGAIVLALTDRADVQAPEAYALTVEPAGVRIEAGTAAGLFYGVQTLRQLLPPEVEYSAARIGPLDVPAVVILDAPRYPWRGAMLDVARHFFGVAAIEQYLDHMALYKLNRLHLHLSDDQGWRVEIPGWPRLTTVGAQNEVGGGPGGYLSTADYEHLVRYAADRFITVVPEIDMPGHIHAALVAHPDLSCDGEPREPYTGIRVGFSALCVEQEATYAFLDDVIGALAARTPGAWFHIGGDEVQTLSHEQYATFVQRAEALVAAHGKRLVGWDEIAGVPLQPGATLQLWRPFWDDLTHPDSARRARAHAHADAVVGAVEGGAHLILSPADRIYLDMKVDSTTALGLAWAGYNGVRDAYDWGETPWLDALPDGAIIGIEAPLWTETIATVADLEAMAFPRLVGVAERGWSSRETLDWDDYRVRLARQAPRWHILGLNYTRVPEVWNAD
ncbi:MAG: family 20 glycosylhydrolase [Rhodothermaceae bacterium]|nr:family 20 glycosylhydrolase [Rhodothermaceae bacterium]